MTFLPYANFEESARVLDYRRLGCQRKETWQILKINTGVDLTSNWRFHPCVKMWKGHEDALSDYGVACCTEWINRGHTDNMIGLIASFKNSKQIAVMPSWLGNEKLHSSHRKALLTKNYEWYSQFDWQEEPFSLFDKIEYFWPSYGKTI